jgi:hypothetical protein
MSALHRRPIALSLSFSLAPRSLPSGPALPRSCSSATFARFAHGRRPPLFARQQRRPHPTVGIRCRPPCASDSRASPPPLLLPPPRGRTHADPLFPLCPRHRAAFQKRRPPPHCPPCCALCPSSSTVILPARGASSRGPSRALNAAPLRRFGSRHCRHLGLMVSSASPGFPAKFPPLLTSPPFTSAPGAGHHLCRLPYHIVDPWNDAVLCRHRCPSIVPPPRCYPHRCLHTLWWAELLRQLVVAMGLEMLLL